MDSNNLKLRLNNEEVKFNICLLIKKLRDMSVVSVIDVVEKFDFEVPFKERFSLETFYYCGDKFRW